MKGRFDHTFIEFIKKEFGDKPFQIRDIENERMRKICRKFLCYSNNIPNQLTPHFERIFVDGEGKNTNIPVRKYRLKEMNTK